MIALRVHAKPRFPQHGHVARLGAATSKSPPSLLRQIDVGVRVDEHCKFFGEPLFAARLPHPPLEFSVNVAEVNHVVEAY